MLNLKQKALLSVATAKALQEGSGIEIEKRTLHEGEFAPIESKNRSGGVVFNNSLISGELAKGAGFCFLPVIDHLGTQSLGLFLFSKMSGKLINIANVDPEQTASMVADLMVSASQYEDPTIASNVIESVTKSVVECDYQIKSTLLQSSRNALNEVFEPMVQKRLEAQKKDFDATLANVQQEAETKITKTMVNQFLKLAEIATEAKTSVRNERYENELLPTVKKLAVIAKKYE